MLRIDKKYSREIFKNYQDTLRLLRLRRLKRLFHAKERISRTNPEAKLRMLWSYMNCPTKVPSRMRCDLCEQNVPEKAKDRFKCIRCKAKYCSKEHQKVASKFHHRTCFVEEPLAPLPSPVAKSLTNIPVTYVKESRELLDQNTNLSQNLHIAKYVVENLYKHGHCILDHFHGDEIAKTILQEVKTLHANGSFKDGQLQSTTGHGTPNRKIREDVITWKNGTEEDCDAIAYHMSLTDALLQLCNYFIKENEIEHRSPAMVACYPGKGTGYKRHIDNPNKDGRLITTIYYLNQDWNPEVDGGVLKLFPEQKCFPESKQSEVSVAPMFDRLMLFWSDKRNPHEVCPAFRRRYAITLWYFDSAERRSFFEQLKQKQKKLPEKSETKEAEVTKNSNEKK